MDYNHAQQIEEKMHIMFLGPCFPSLKKKRKAHFTREQIRTLAIVLAANDLAISRADGEAFKKAIYQKTRLMVMIMVVRDG